MRLGWVGFAVALFLAAGCGSSAKKGLVGGDVKAPADAVADVAEDATAVEDVTRDLGAPDPGPQDPGEPDPGIPDLGPADLGPADPGQPDLGPADPGPVDPGTPDPGPQDTGPVSPYSEMVQDCMYVVTGICDKLVKKCKDQLFGLIKDEWLDACTNWLTDQELTIAGACMTLDNVESTDPNVQLIQSMAPGALRQCIDNVQCNLETAGKVGDFMLKIVKGTKPGTAEILGLVAGLCFK
jgi:hypothetical protein